MSSETLDQLAVLQATDKSSIEHDYARHYEDAFKKFRDEPIELLEIGVADGASLRMWEGFFSKAKLIGVDIIPDCLRFAGGRKIVEIGSQEDPEFLQGLAVKYSPSIIIDDGSHQADHIRMTIEQLFPALRPGGCYVIEDLHFHLDPQDRDRPTGALKLALDLAFLATKAHIEVHNREEKALYFLETIDRVDFIKHAALIWKKVPDANPSKTVAEMRELVEQSASGRNWFFFIYYALDRGGSLEQSETAARKAISLGGIPGPSYWRLSEVLERRGDLPGALAAAEQAYKINPDIPEIKSRVERLMLIIEP